MGKKFNKRNYSREGGGISGGIILGGSSPMVNYPSGEIIRGENYARGKFSGGIILGAENSPRGIFGKMGEGELSGGNMHTNSINYILF